MLTPRTTASLIFLAGVIVASRNVHTAQFRARIQGVVKEADTGRPLQGAKVYLFDPDREVPMTNSEFTVADDLGRFAITILSPGPHRLLPAYPGYVWSRPARLLEPRAGVVVRVSEANATAEVAFQMVREGSITGQVLDVATGDPLPNAIVTLALKAFNSSGSLVAGIVPRADNPTIRTNDRGEYRFYGLQPGSYYVRLPASSGKPIRFYPGVEDFSQAERILVEAGQETRIPPVLVESPDRTARVTFHFSDSGKNVTQGMLRLPGSSAFTVIQRGMTPSFDASQLSVRLTRGKYDLLFQLRSGQNDLFYARPKFEVGSEDLDINVTLMPGIAVTGSLRFTDAQGTTLDTAGIGCLLVPQTDDGMTAQLGGTSRCVKSEATPGRYAMEMSGLPPDAYVVSARASQRDVLRDGLEIEQPVTVDIVLSTPGTAIEGIVTNSQGEKLSGATVALVPDSPYRDAGLLYRSDVSTHDGSFELRGIAPGSYQLFAWADVRGAGYRNAEFLKDYEGKGKQIKVEGASRITANLTAFE